jgi:hypothetical protein
VPATSLMLPLLTTGLILSSSSEHELKIIKENKISSVYNAFIIE